MTLSGVSLDHIQYKSVVFSLKVNQYVFRVCMWNRPYSKATKNSLSFNQLCIMAIPSILTNEVKFTTTSEIFPWGWHRESAKVSNWQTQFHHCSRTLQWLQTSKGRIIMLWLGRIADCAWWGWHMSQAQCTHQIGSTPSGRKQWRQPRRLWKET